MSVEEYQRGLQARGKVAAAEQFLVLAHQRERLETGLRRFWVQSSHVDQGAHCLPASRAPDVGRASFYHLQ